MSQVSASSVSLAAVSFQGLRVAEIASMIVELASKGVPLYIDEKIYRDIGPILEKHGLIVVKVNDPSPDEITGILLRSLGTNPRTMSVRIEVYSSGTLVTQRTVRYAKLREALLELLGEGEEKTTKTKLPSPLYVVKTSEEGRRDG